MFSPPNTGRSGIPQYGIHPQGIEQYGSILRQPMYPRTQQQQCFMPMQPYRLSLPGYQPMMGTSYPQGYGAQSQYAFIPPHPQYPMGAPMPQYPPVALAGWRPLPGDSALETTAQQFRKPPRQETSHQEKKVDTASSFQREKEDVERRWKTVEEYYQEAVTTPKPNAATIKDYKWIQLRFWDSRYTKKWKQTAQDELKRLVNTEKEKELNALEIKEAERIRASRPQEPSDESRSRRIHRRERRPRDAESSSSPAVEIRSSKPSVQPSHGSYDSYKRRRRQRARRRRHRSTSTSSSQRRRYHENKKKSGRRRERDSGDWKKPEYSSSVSSYRRKEKPRRERRDDHVSRYQERPEEAIARRQRELELEKKQRQEAEVLEDQRKEKRAAIAVHASFVNPVLHSPFDFTAGYQEHWNRMYPTFDPSALALHPTAEMMPYGILGTSSIPIRPIPVASLHDPMSSSRPNSFVEVKTDVTVPPKLSGRTLNGTPQPTAKEKISLLASTASKEEGMHKPPSRVKPSASKFAVSSTVKQKLENMKLDPTSRHSGGARQTYHALSQQECND